MAKVGSGKATGKMMTMEEGVRTVIGHYHGSNMPFHDNKPVKLVSCERLNAATDLDQDSAKAKENQPRAKANGQDWDMGM